MWCDIILGRKSKFAGGQAVRWPFHFLSATRTVSAREHDEIVIWLLAEGNGSDSLEE